MKLVWSAAAADDLAAAIGYISNDLGSPAATGRLFDSIVRKAQLFADVPGAGLTLRTREGFDTGYRYVVGGNWMAFFSCSEEEALVVRVLYAKSDYMKTLFGDGQSTGEREGR